MRVPSLSPNGILEVEYSALQKYSSPLAFSLFCCITTCNLNPFLFGFHVMDMNSTTENIKKGGPGVFYRGDKAVSSSIYRDQVMKEGLLIKVF
jgi:hypothetical protein